MENVWGVGQNRQGAKVKVHARTNDTQRSPIGKWHYGESKRIKDYKFLKSIKILITKVGHAHLEMKNNDNLDLGHILKQTSFPKKIQVHSGRVFKGEGDKTVPTDRNKWNFGIFFEILSEW